MQIRGTEAAHGRRAADTGTAARPRHPTFARGQATAVAGAASGVAEHGGPAQLGNSLNQLAHHRNAGTIAARDDEHATLAGLLDGPLAKLARTKRPIQGARAQVRAGPGASPWATGATRDPQTCRLVYHGAGAAAAPAAILTACGDAPSNPRSALDLPAPAPCGSGKRGRVAGAGTFRALSIRPDRSGAGATRPGARAAPA